LGRHDTRPLAVVEAPGDTLKDIPKELHGEIGDLRNPRLSKPFDCSNAVRSTWRSMRLRHVITRSRATATSSTETFTETRRFFCAFSSKNLTNWLEARVGIEPKPLMLKCSPVEGIHGAALRFVFNALEQ
jgi:hypothetical protein